MVSARSVIALSMLTVVALVSATPSAPQAADAVNADRSTDVPDIAAPADVAVAAAHLEAVRRLPTNAARESAIARLSQEVLRQSSVPAGERQAFEVASVKPNVSGSSNVSFGATPGGYAATNVPLRLLIAVAYRVRSSQVIGLPDWINADRFDVVARGPQGADPSSVLSRLRELLRERFMLVARLEDREQPIYALVRTGARASPHLKPTVLECLPPGTPANPCRMNGTIGAASGSLKATGQTMADLAAYLTNNVDRVVIDRTELHGRFDFELTWTADDVRGLAIDPLTDDSRPLLATALLEHLGLKLDSARGPVQFLVIESVARPTSD